MRQVAAELVTASLSEDGDGAPLGLLQVEESGRNSTVGKGFAPESVERVI